MWKYSVLQQFGIETGLVRNNFVSSWRGRNWGFAPWSDTRTQALLRFLLPPSSWQEVTFPKSMIMV
jgi:hypothetical protein